jgi:DMSO/TMAO reductase YedYZ molybdopterin-dependent catalytic subunit
VEERVIVSREPLNAETRLELQDGPITPPSRHYVRSHFAFPEAPTDISVRGAMRHPRSLSIAELRALPARTLTVTLECAGNGRSFLEPPAPGEQWGLGAVSTAEWTGVPLRSILEPCGLSATVVEVLFRGADAGTPSDVGARICFERSLPIGRALADDVLVAYAMNGADLPRELGAPARLIVPGWYGMASVKWLAEIIAIEQPFRGFYQADRYVIGDEPLAAMRPRAVIVAPSRAVPARTASVIRGYAWSGRGPVERVEVSTDGGASWREAALGADNGAAAWREFRADWTPRIGAYGLLARATDAAGDTQSLGQVRNSLGYANNAAQPVRVDAR